MVRDDKGGVIIEIYVVLVGTKHSGNIGAVARTCSNFNVKNLILVSPLCEIDDHAYERATKGRFYLDNAIIVSDIKEIDNYVDLKIALSARIGGYNNLSRSSIPITTLAEDISNNKGRIGLVFGREDYGLSNDEVNHCDVLTYIPLPSENQVLNISHAASLSLWEIMRKSSMKSFAEKLANQSPEHNEPLHDLMSNEKKQALFKFLNEILPHTWIKEESYSGVIRVINTILGRALVTHREGNSLVGTFRGISRTLNEGHPPWDNCDKPKSVEES